MSSGRVEVLPSLAPNGSVVRGSSPRRPLGEVALGRAPFHWGNPNGSPGSTPGLSTLHSGSSKNGPGGCRHACDFLELDERCPNRKVSTHGCRFESCLLYSRK
jgi:hypothetical protein